MLNFILSLIIIFLSLIGISEIIYFFGSLLFKPPLTPKKYLILKLDKNCAEQQILSELFKIHWFGDRFSQKIIFLTDNLEPDEISRLKKEYTSGLAEFKSGVFNE